MEFPKALVGPTKLGLALADLGLTAAQQTAGVARDVVHFAADQVDPEAAKGQQRSDNLVTAVMNVPYILGRCADLIAPGGAIDRLVGPGGAVDRVADLFDEDGLVDRVIRPGGPLDQATAPGGIVDRLVAEDGVISTIIAEDGLLIRTIEMTNAVAEIAPVLLSMNQQLAVIQDVVGAANNVAAPVTNVLASIPKFAIRTAADAARAGASAMSGPTQDRRVVEATVVAPRPPAAPKSAPAAAPAEGKAWAPGTRTTENSGATKNSGATENPRATGASTPAARPVVTPPNPSTPRVDPPATPAS
ncbi:hypothetical protein [Tsukamurella soli]|uniref:Uncharacterized protein n=1 Tax=Tsukamurella soli TaxID=644556 RepID=A0ABP8KEW3_9ACTN